MNPNQIDEEAVFELARKIDSAEIRADYLDQVCGTNSDLKGRVARLLEIHDRNTSFLESPAAGPAPTLDIPPIQETCGDVIGAYKLLQQIGEGGFGVVYMARQTVPVRRNVALKIIKAGMDTREVIARFEAERQALAMMDHPNIARVLDGGATESGRPYFVMELVKGVPLTEYCDQNQALTGQRLVLFKTVCQAVQHAHQKGIIHRDLKPSNILVTLHDGEPVAKVIDFGVAKAINQQLTERTLFTEFGQMVGTPQYMSPEQAEMSGLDVDTRSDVYSLGVVLYELLTGTTPLDAERLRSAGYVEMQRLICEDEPPKPSTRLSTSGVQLTAIAKHRSLSPEQLQKTVRGDLDWIVMKALEKDRGRRYETPSSFADDLDRFLGDAPVEACPPSPMYRARKFARRNQALIGTATVVVVTLFAATTLSTWFAWERNRLAERAGQLAVDAQRSESAALEGKQIAESLAQQLSVKNHQYERSMIEVCMLYAIHGDFKEVEQLLASVGDESFPMDWKRTLQGVAHLHRGENDDAIKRLKEALAHSPENVSARAMLTLALVHSGLWDEWSATAEDLVDATPRREYEEFDKLFLGYASFYYDLDDSARRIEEIVGRNRTWLMARAMLAAVKAHQAEERNDPQLMLAAIEQNQVPELLLTNDNPFTLAMCFYVYRTALLVLDDPPREYIELTEKSAAKLDEYRSYAVGSVVRSVYYDSHGPIENALSAWRDLLDSGRGMHLHWASAGMLKNGYGEELLEVDLASWDDPEALTAFAYVFALSSAPSHREKAWEMYEDLVPKAATATERFMVIQIPLLLQKRPVATQQAAKWLDAGTPKQIPLVWSRNRIDYVANVGQCLKATQSTDRREAAFANLQYALIKYADGDYQLALEHLNQCEDSRLNRFWSWYVEALKNKFAAHLDDMPECPTTSL